MTFSESLEQLRFGHTVRRSSWSESYLKLYVIPISGSTVTTAIYLISSEGVKSFWTPNQEDILSNDWEIRQ